MKKRIFKELLSWSIYIIGAFISVLVINTFIVQPTQVQGRSMEGTLKNNDRIIINKLSTINKSYDYGDIVVIDSRVDKKRTVLDELGFNLRNNLIAFLITKSQDDYYWIKRIVGKEGDIIEFTENTVMLNGEILEEPYLDKPARYNIDEQIIVPKGHIFVLGDNRNVSEDSRHIGTVPIENVIGSYWLKVNRN
ncbi:signal peptidase I [Natranaerovirga pectinivora]|uniref:Signal peptidase I n=1 Tax=Natranaerovirga pectinivora TaxID=682400 RepID=A0A4R3MI46_9FIRM|nr:signal peptidase I [Natranaerovirga pectinivora]TCT12107.1 signal peptidase I [Natranaerovirga pectinivora]